MSIRPIDVIMMPPKSQEASTQQNADQHRMIHAQEQAGVHFNKEINHNHQKTTEAQKKERQDKKYDAKEEGNNKYQKQKTNKKVQKQDEDKKTIKMSNFDITI